MHSEREGKHTPVPWIVQPVSSVSPDHPDYGVAYVVGDNLGGLIGAALPWPTEIDEGGFDRVIANAHLIAAAPKLKEALAGMLDFWGGYECPEVDAAIAVMQEIGEDRWSMQARMDAEKAEANHVE